MISAEYKTIILDALKKVGTTEADIAKGELYIVKHLVDRLGPLLKVSEKEKVDQIFFILSGFAKGEDGVLGTADDLLTPDQLAFFKQVFLNDTLLKQMVTYFVHKQVTKYRKWLVSKITCL